MDNPLIPRVNRQVEKPRNRALDTRRDDDTFVVPSITPYDIDYAILAYIKEVIKPQVIEDGKLTDQGTYDELIIKNTNFKKMTKYA